MSEPTIEEAVARLIAAENAAEHYRLHSTELKKQNAEVTKQLAAARAREERLRKALNKASIDLEWSGYGWVIDDLQAALEHRSETSSESEASDD